MLTSPCSSSSLLCHRPALSSSRSKFRVPCRTVFSPALTQISPLTAASPSKAAKHVRFFFSYLCLFNQLWNFELTAGLTSIERVVFELLWNCRKKCFWENLGFLRFSSIVIKCLVAMSIGKWEELYSIYICFDGVSVKWLMAYFCFADGESIVYLQCIKLWCYFLQKWKILCFRNEDSAPENPEHFVPEELVKPDQDSPCTDKKDWKATLQKVKISGRFWILVHLKKNYFFCLCFSLSNQFWYQGLDSRGLRPQQNLIFGSKLLCIIHLLVFCLLMFSWKRIRGFFWSRNVPYNW